MKRPPLLALAALAALILAGCATPRQMPANPPADSLCGNPSLPAQAISRVLLPHEWDSYAARKYTGYVVMSGRIKNGKITVGRIVESWPDSVPADFARKLGESIPATSTTVGSHITPAAEIYVVFYEKLSWREALIYARQTETVAPATGNGVIYAKIKRY